jgi:hypothetical protein
LTDRLRKHGIAVDVTSPGAPIAELLAGARDRRRALDAVLTDAGRTVPTDALDAAPVGQSTSSPRAIESADPSASNGPDISGDAAEVHVGFGVRRWRVRGADRNRTPDVLRVALSVTDTTTGAFHLDTIDLYAAKARAAFLDAATAELSSDPASLRPELTEVLFATETALANVDAHDPVPAMSEQEREAALELLRDPALLDRITADLGALGVVGTDDAARHLPRDDLPQGRPTVRRGHPVLVCRRQVDPRRCLCALVPEEDLASFSALPGQALYYVSGQSLAHKVLAVAEEQGASRAAYALKLLLTEGRLTIGSTGKDPATGRLRTTNYQVAER